MAGDQSSKTCPATQVRFWLWPPMPFPSLFQTEIIEGTISYLRPFALLPCCRLVLLQLAKGRDVTAANVLGERMLLRSPVSLLDLYQQLGRTKMIGLVMERNETDGGVVRERIPDVERDLE